MSFGCEFITAATALQWGLVNEVVYPSMLMSRAVQIAKGICNVNAGYLQVMKNLIEAQNSTTFEKALAMEKKGFKAFVAQQIK